MHLKRRFCYLKETPENHHGILTSQGRYVYTPHPRTGQLLYVRTADDGSPQLYHPLPAVPATPIQPSQPDTSQFSTPKVLIINDEYLALPYLIMMFDTCQYAFFF